jgi:protein-tyrosine phosphatase
MTTRILFVCLGNICRSPSAEGVFAARAAAARLDVETDSAGTSNWHIGDPPYGLAIQTAQNRGVDISGLRARQLTVADFDRFDLIIGMDAANISDINALRPAGNTTRIALFTDYAPQSGATEVPDPYYTRDFDGALDLIETASDGLITALQSR